MKRFLSIIALAIMFVIGVNAQVAPAKFFDNTSIELKGGLNSPMNGFLDGVSGQIGIQVDKFITPWLGVGFDSEFFMHQPYWNTPHTAFDAVNLNGLVELNLFNLFGKYPGYRRGFEMIGFAGLGWGHFNDSHSDWFARNYLVYKAGLDLEWNLTKAWAIKLSPAVVWGNKQGGKLDSNKGMLELNVGMVYHFKNKDGNRYFTKIKPYNQEEVNFLNERINSLREENELLIIENTNLKNNPQILSVVETVTEVVDNNIIVLPPVQFELNSSVIPNTSESVIKEIASVINANPDSKFTITGYASNEGTEKYNIGLSQRRAESVVKALSTYGVNLNQLTLKADGITTQFSTENPSLNRVVVIE